ncbi:MAG TPA: hypothetical protein VFQ50_09930 [Flavobacterium sp.]|nr:hypothetical protein [Flavobacterium sp.]
MKNVKLLLMLLVSTTIFFSCSDSEPIENQGNAESSVALRTTLAEYKKAHGISSKSANDEEFCFDFVYPITFSYNTGTAVTVTSFEGLLEILSNESSDFYLDGVVFPFQVSQQASGGVTFTTINSESEFVELLQACGIDTIDADLQTTFCFDIVFPINISMPDGADITVESMVELEALANSSSDFQGEIDFPISVLYDGQTVVLNNVYDFYEMLDNCDQCICTADYAPVCVQTPLGVVEYGNICFAICAGFTQDDFVMCGPTNNCSITNLQVQPGDCSAAGDFDLLVNFSYSNPPSTQFEIRNSNNIVVSTHNLSDLPVTIPNYAILGITVEFLTVNFVGDTNCGATTEWSIPANCGGNGSFASNLGSCFNMVYPVGVQSQGAVVTVTNDTQLLLYTTATGSLPPFSYPVAVTFNGSSTTTVNSSAQFQTLMDANCN